MPLASSSPGANRGVLPDDRSRFLHDVADELGRFEALGEGLIARVAAEAQRRYLRPPDLSRSRDTSRWR